MCKNLKALNYPNQILLWKATRTFPDKSSCHWILRGNWCSTLTHPNFSKLSSSQPFLQLEGFSWDFPGILFPWLLGFSTNAGVSEWLTQSITLLCENDRDTSHLWICLCMSVKSLCPALMQKPDTHAGKDFQLVAVTMQTVFLDNTEKIYERGICLLSNFILCKSN